MSDTLEYVINKTLTVAELIKKLQALPTEFKDAEVWVGEIDENGDGTNRPLNGMDLMDEWEQDGVTFNKSISLISDDYNN